MPRLWLLNLLIAVSALCACASKPPAPPECDGPLEPINAATNSATRPTDALSSADRSLQGEADATRPGN